jgi:hypothetical protein
MSIKTIVYLCILFTAALVLALGGWLVKGAKVLTGQKRQPSIRTRLA